MKQVPESEELRYNPASRTLVREGVTPVINAFDKRSLTEAIRLRGVHGGTITAVTMGPPQARDALVECLGRGVDRCVHICDPAFAGSDTLATARTLAAALRHRAFDLLMLGKWSTDSETGQVGPELAEMLDLPQVVGTTAIEVAGDALLVARETDLGFERLECPLPALLTCAEHLIKPTKTKPEVISEGQRRISADSALIETLTAADLGLPPEQTGLSGSATWVTALRPVEINRDTVLLSGDALSSAKSVLRELETRRVGVKLSDSSRPPSPPRLSGNGKAIWAVAECLPGPDGSPSLRRVSLELSSEATRIAKSIDGRAVCVLIGHNLAPLAAEMASYGTTSVLMADDARLAAFTAETYAWVLARAIQEHQPWAVLFPATSFGQDLAPRVAAKLGLGLTSDCLGLEIGHEGELLQIKPAFGGQVVAPISSRTL
ncbi:MAG TPA: hypothetical protein VM409_06420, partial [Chloroflexia bacterium]|nr:hypothetical protein [Chloroflexia bacterium]